MHLISCPELGCAATAEVIDRITVRSTGRPVELVRTYCARRHILMLPAQRVPRAHISAPCPTNTRLNGIWYFYVSARRLPAQSLPSVPGRVAGHGRPRPRLTSVAADIRLCQHAQGGLVWVSCQEEGQRPAVPTPAEGH
jgi:hypothetical protein